MAGDLKALIRYHKWRLDEKRRALADLHSLAERLREQLAALEAEIKAEQDAARQSTEAALTFANYIAQANFRKKTLASSIAQVDRQIDVATDEMSEVFQEVKRYEIAQEERNRREKEKIRQRETAMFDEVAASGFQRRQRESGAGS
ncbi:MAG TPA: flagellar export protein FliJ [Azospirillaceae bacterium]|nr:flagellar export protein FliJ [Azospirillaceae bacterium]